MADLSLALDMFGIDFQPALGIQDRLVVVLLILAQPGEIVKGHRGLGLDFERSIELLPGLVVLVPFTENRAQPLMRRGRVFLELDRLAIFPGGIFQALVGLVGTAQIVVCERVVGVESNGFFHIRDCALGVPPPEQRTAERAPAHRVVFGDRQGVLKELDVVAPERDLLESEKCVDGDRTDCGGRQNPATQPPIGHKRGDQPGDSQVEPQQRQIGVAIGHPLLSDLDQADQGKQSAQIPKPADDQIGTSSHVDVARRLVAAARNAAGTTTSTGRSRSIGCG